MVIYLDTSSFVKLYANEAGADAVRALVERADLVVTSSITYSETRSTFARYCREKIWTRSEHSSITKQFQSDWAECLTMAVSDSITEAAGDLAEQHALHGCDAIQLATFVQVLQRSDDEDIEFSSFDERLNKAARSLG
jgi:predicted nucleic acid-binding protein